MHAIPTLLIGLGGIGSKIVNDVFGSIPENERERIIVHAFDTNINDISNLKNLDKNDVTQTSADRNVSQYLRGRDEEILKQWFPHEKKILLDKTLTDGAGQIRAVSRLAFRAALEDNKLENLERKIDRLFRIDGDTNTSSIRVMVVNSIGGGTGAGIFLQVAMYIRDYIENRKNKKVLIKGSFVLPDVVIPEIENTQQIENIRANGYACLKELDCITSIADGSANVNLELEFKPNQRDSQGKINFDIGNKRPYDFVFLYDYENDDEKNLGKISNYMNQIAKNIYLQLFSPISGDSYSKEDNEILNHIKKGSKNRYCGAGSTSIIYPYEDIISYATSLWASESISEKWLKIDREFDLEYKKWEKDQQKGIKSLPPEKSIFCNEFLEKFEGKNDAFFSILLDSGKADDDRLKKHEAFLPEIEKLIKNMMSEDNEFQQNLKNTSIDRERLQDSKQTITLIEEVENEIVKLNQKVDDFIRRRKSAISRDILPDNEDLKDEPFELSYWIAGKESKRQLHPLAARYFIYGVKNKIKEELDSNTFTWKKGLRKENAELLVRINRYKNDFKDEDKNILTVYEKAEYVTKLGIKDLFKTNFKRFVAEYEDLSKQQVERLRKYCLNKMIEDAYVEVLEYIDEILKNEIEKFFGSLNDILYNMKKEIEKKEKEHEQNSNPTLIYILGKKEHKKELCNEALSKSKEKDKLDPQVAKEIFLAQNERTFKRRNQVRVADQSIEKMSNFFNNTIKKWFEIQARNSEQLDLNIVTALEKEAEFLGKYDDDIHKYIVDKIREADNKCRPFIPKVYSGEKNEILTWGLHNECRELFTEDKYNETFGNTNQPIVDEAFSKYEIVRYRARYGMEAQDFPKFRAPDLERGIASGDYYNAYDSVKRNLNRGETVTPHLDKRWHLPAYMPDINQREAQEDKEKIDRAFLIGLILNKLQLGKEDNTSAWSYYGLTGSKLLKRGNEEIVEEEYHKLHDSMRYNPIIVDEILNSDYLKEDTKKYEELIKEHEFYRGCFRSFKKSNNILDVIFNYFNEYRDKSQGDDDIKKDGEILLNTLLGEIENYISSVYRKDKAKTAKEKASEFIEDLKNQSILYSEADKESSLYKNWESILTRKIKELNPN